MKYTYFQFLTKLKNEYKDSAAIFAEDAKRYRQGTDLEAMYLDLSNASSDKAWALDILLADMPIDYAGKTVGVE